jgi:hypothetical protein
MPSSHGSTRAAGLEALLRGFFTSGFYCTKAAMAPRGFRVRNGCGIVGGLRFNDRGPAAGQLRGSAIS